MKTNVKTKAVYTPAAEEKLRRAVLSTLLWEDQFYENGKLISQRIEELAAEVSPEQLAKIADEARNQHHLRHAPLFLAVQLVKHGAGKQGLVADTIDKVVQRADELAELVSLYWLKGKRPLSSQMKKGLAKAFNKFSAYSLAKYNRDGAVKLRDVLFLVHPKAKDSEQQKVFDKLASNTLESPDTWEVGLSAGADKKTTFERLLSENKLGYLALLRNLRNMEQAGVDRTLVREAILARRGAERVLPFRYVAAARAVPSYEPALDSALLAGINELPRLDGRTVVLVDVSGSMGSLLSGKSDLTRMDAACTLASVLNCEDVRIFSFSDRVVEVPARKGMAGVQAIKSSQRHNSTALAEAVRQVNQMKDVDRLIVITDEQATDGRVPTPSAKKAYMINVASSTNGVESGRWSRINGFSENVIRWIYETEKLA